jgi:hypothetical protein
VRIEIETAFTLGLTVIPILVEEASMPAAAQLPASLHELRNLQRVSVRSNPYFTYDITGVVGAVERAFANRRSDEIGADEVVPQVPSAAPPAQALFTGAPASPQVTPSAHASPPIAGAR